MTANQSSAGATDESPGKISLSTRQPARSAILICERRAVGKNFANFCRSVDSNRCQHLQYLAKGRNQRPATRVTGGALPLPTIQYLFTISLAKTQTDSDGVVGMCSFSSPQFLGTQGRRVLRSLFVPPVHLGENLGSTPSAPTVFSNSPALAVHHPPPC